MQIHNQQDMRFEKAITGGAFVEIERLAAAEHMKAGHVDVDFVGIEFYAGAAGGGEDAAPIRIPARESGFDQRRSGDGLGDFAGASFSGCAANFNFDDTLRAFAISNNLESERVANGFKSFEEVAMSCGARVNGGGTGSTVGKDEQSVVG